jgi:hypothetical protein
MSVAAPFDMALYDDTAFRWDERASLSHAWPRYLALLLGLWLFVSAFAWPHSRDACAASWIMGGCIAMNAFAAIFAPPARYFNVLLGGMSLAWQVSAATGQPTSWLNGVVVSSLVIGLAFVPSGHPKAAVPTS